MASLELRNINKIFEKHRAVEDISLSIADGEFIVLLGPSGCGKSTLLRMIAGLDMPTEGDIVIGERVVTQLAPKDRDIAMVFQNYALYPHLSIYENIAFPLRVRGWDNDKIAAKVKWAAEIVEIVDLFQRKPREISGGQRQRCALARSLVRDPAVFLLDEPLSNLDAKLRHSARDQLRDFQARVGMTSVYVTHDQTEAMALGDRIVVMDKGNIRQVGTPRQIYEEPADTFVATFIGSPPMNMAVAGARTVGFRPENFLPSGFFPADTDLVQIAFRPERVEYLGDEQLYYGKTEGEFSAGHVVARIPSTLNLPITLKQLNNFAVARRDLRHFETASGKALPGDASASGAQAKVAHV